jgi:hypothetical protein
MKGSAVDEIVDQKEANSAVDQPYSKAGAASYLQNALMAILAAEISAAFI